MKPKPQQGVKMDPQLSETKSIKKHMHALPPPSNTPKKIERTEIEIEKEKKDPKLT